MNTWKHIKSNWPLVLLLVIAGIITVSELLKALSPANKLSANPAVNDSTWVPPSLYTDELLQGKERELVIYGEDLISHTSRYFGPHGSVAAITNGMNCQNCHLNAGKKNWGNNYSAVFSTYPKFRDRSGRMESIYKRVSDCFERSLNGSAPDSNSKKYPAIYSQLKWLGHELKKREKTLCPWD